MVNLMKWHPLGQKALAFATWENSEHGLRGLFNEGDANAFLKPQPQGNQLSDNPKFIDEIVADWPDRQPWQRPLLRRLQGYDAALGEVDSPDNSSQS